MADPQARGGAVRLVGLTKSFDDAHAVRGIDLDVHAGEFFSLLGPSGCGKTTTLRMIAGFEPPTAGQILLDGDDLVEVPAHQRPVNTVFQSYALFPFLDVWDNVAFGLRYQHVDKAAGRRRVGEMLDLVQMSEHAHRRPGQLSGGQQQRVALARALVLQPRVLLLDEPLGALDAKLRKHLQLELKAIQQEVGVTFVYVTHDQEEALTMSDRLAVMRDGRIEQLGAPEAVYAAPDTAYVAGFLGSANVLDVEALGQDVTGTVGCRLGGLDAARRRHVARGRAEGHGASGADLPGTRGGHGPCRQGAQHVPRPGRPRRLPRAGDARRGAAGGRADPARGRAQHRRADVVAVRHRARGARQLPAGGGAAAHR